MILKQKKWLIAGVAGVILLTAPLYSQGFWKAAAPQPVYAAELGEQRNIITVTGQGEITVAPDVAYVNLGIWTEAPTAQEAQSANAEAFVKLEKMLYEDYKLDKKDVKTSGFSVQPVYSYTDRDPKVKGYSATQTLQVTYRDLGKLGEFLDAAAAAGANRINGVQFSTEKAGEYELQAIEKAMDNAKAKAETIARYAGKELKGIVGVSQGGGVSVPRAYAEVGGASLKLTADSAVSTSITPGELTITTNVTVQYEF
jgi:hypothetical protein